MPTVSMQFPIKHPNYMICDNKYDEQSFKIINPNKFIKASRVLDMKDGSINPIKVAILQDKYSEEVLVKGFNDMAEEIDRDFHTLSYLIRFFKTEN